MARLLTLGEPAPWFHAPALSGNPHYGFDTVAGRWVVLLFMGTGTREESQAALRLIEANGDLFDDRQAAFFGVTVDPSDAQSGRIVPRIPGIRWFLDYDRKVSTRYGAASAGADKKLSYHPHWLLLDPMLRVSARAALADGAGLIATLRQQLGAGYELPTAPVLVVPDLLSRDLCRRLIELYDTHGGEPTGSMHEVNGITVERIDRNDKRRADYQITDERMIEVLRGRVGDVLRPLIRRAFQFDASRIERWIVSCYDGADRGYFRTHRDNMTKGTAHRKFACTVNLNAEDYDGGDLCFPEFGQRTYRAPTGGAIIFSCSLMHEARPVTRGKRYAFLPFLYDDEGARIREQNLAFVSPDLQGYRSGLPPAEGQAPAS